MAAVGAAASAKSRVATRAARGRSMCTTAIDHLAAGGALGQKIPFIGAGQGVARQSFAQTAFQCRRQGLRRDRHAVQRIGFFVDRFHRAIMGALGVICQECNGQTKQHANDVDERRRHAL